MRWRVPGCPRCKELLGRERIEAGGLEYHEECWKKMNYV